MAERGMVDTQGQRGDGMWADSRNIRTSAFTLSRGIRHELMRISEITRLKKKQWLYLSCRAMYIGSSQ